MRSLKFGAVLNYTPELLANSDWDGLKKVAIHCEKLQYDSVWVMDHLTYHGHPTVMECYTTLAALAASTSKIRIGSLVSCNLFRHPAFVAKMAATLDVISNGRLEFGIGAGWKEDECRMYGIEFENARQRIKRLREASLMIKKIWTQPGVSYSGKHYRIENMTFGPKLRQKPHPPIWIGGKGDFLLRVVAELADYSNMGQSVSREEYHRKMETLKKHCAVFGRDYNNISKSVGLEVIIGKTKDEAQRKLRHAYASQYFGSDSRTENVSLEEYVKKRLVGTPEQCITQLRLWLKEDIDYVLVGWTMNQKDWTLFSERVIPAFK